MTSTKEINQIEEYKKKFSVEIDLTMENNATIKKIASELKDNSWVFLNQIADIIKNGK